MTPNTTSNQRKSDHAVDKKIGHVEEKTRDYKVEIVWRNVILYTYLHVGAFYGLYLLLFYAQWKTVFFSILLYQLSILGITAGAHRLWAHRSYKAKLPLKMFLTFCNTLAFQNSAIDWVRDHRVHHKFSDTNADPHNATRGFFFSHIGWILCRKHPDIKIKGKGIDLSDLENDPVLVFQKKYYLTLVAIICFIIPTFIPIYYWGESFGCAWFTATMLRYCFSLNMIWLINSLAHMWGIRPYDASIRSSENLCVSLGTLGEGWHNYHHVFPWDYKAAELGNYRANTTTAFIDLMASIGLAYDLKTVPSNVVNKRSHRTGDGSRPLWGWGDQDMTPEDAEDVLQISKDE